MAIIIPSNEEVRRVARQSLREHFPLYEEKHSVNAKDIDNRFKTWLSYRTTKDTPVNIFGSTHFDLNFYWPNACYLTYIELHKNHRGQGNGWKLYQTVEDIARKLGFTRLCQTPSGYIEKDGVFIETREDYLVRKGYSRVDGGQVELRL